MCSQFKHYGQLWLRNVEELDHGIPQPRMFALGLSMITAIGEVTIHVHQKDLFMEASGILRQLWYL